MNPVFVDTGFFAAVLCQRDSHHLAAVDALRRLECPIVTTAWVLVELGNLLCQGSNRTRLLAFVEGLRRNSRVTIVPPDVASFDAGMLLYSRRPDKQWSLTDCISFAVMERNAWMEALTFDRHFKQAGFTIVSV